VRNDRKPDGGLAVDIDITSGSRAWRVGLAEAMDSSSQADNACGAVRRRENTLDFAPPTLGAAVCSFPHLASLDSAFIRANIHGRLEALSGPDPSRTVGEPVFSSEGV
jgi:hypothetical protein